VTVDVFAALGDPTRRRLIELLVDGEQAVGTLVRTLAAERTISQPAVSQHLGVLLNVGLVRVRAVGARRLYALDPSGFEEAAGWLARLAERAGPFTQPLDALATEVARGQRVARAAGASSPPASPPSPSAAVPGGG
jgi:DNA-binding transcriptional ArsR family regulator